MRRARYKLRFVLEKKTEDYASETERKQEFQHKHESLHTLEILF